ISAPARAFRPGGREGRLAEPRPRRFAVPIALDAVGREWPVADRVEKRLARAEQPRRRFGLLGGDEQAGRADQRGGEALGDADIEEEIEAFPKAGPGAHEITLARDRVAEVL